ncbi:hypothetical protein GCM10017712_18980 [Curtobacterium citreum]
MPRLSVTAAALSACLVVSVSTPAQALDPTLPAAARPHGTAQWYAVAAGSDPDVQRDGFSIRDDFRRGPRISSDVTVVRPVDGTVPTAGGFGGRHVDGCSACSTDHHGLDFAARAGTPALAVMSGTVVSAGVLGGYGNQVLLRHPDGTETRYAHLSRIDVVVGRQVAVGEPVGAVGSTGISTGAHLHFEVILGGVPVDPAPWLAARGLL